jgi:hypothetical protein
VDLSVKQLLDASDRAPEHAQAGGAASRNPHITCGSLRRVHVDPRRRNPFFYRNTAELTIPLATPFA